jgi:hypothetical protein
VCPKNPHNFNVDNVRVVKLVGGAIHDSSVVNGMVLRRDTDGSVKDVSNAKVVVFAQAVDTAGGRRGGLWRAGGLLQGERCAAAGAQAAGGRAAGGRLPRPACAPRHAAASPLSARRPAAPAGPQAPRPRAPC